MSDAGTGELGGDGAGRPGAAPRGGEGGTMRSTARCGRFGIHRPQLCARPALSRGESPLPSPTYPCTHEHAYHPEYTRQPHCHRCAPSHTYPHTHTPHTPHWMIRQGSLDATRRGEASAPPLPTLHQTACGPQPASPPCETQPHLPGKRPPGTPCVGSFRPGLDQQNIGNPIHHPLANPPTTQPPFSRSPVRPTP